MKTIARVIPLVFMLTIMLFAFAPAAYADTTDTETTEEVTAAAEVTAEASEIGAKAIAAGIAIAVVAAAGAIGMAMAISKSVEGIARQPEAEGSIRTSLMLGLVFVETAIIYALIVAILIIFVL